MVELGWPMLVVVREHPQNLVSQVYMTAAELATCRVPVEHASPAPAVRYVVACLAFFETRFGAPRHRFLHSLLQFYDLELHHLTPLGILHISTFVTMCEAYMGIEPHFNSWNFFHIRLWLDSDVAAVVWGYTEIYVRIGSGINPYFCLSVTNP
jgi:hypothetical protein